MRFAALERGTGLSSATLVKYLHRLSSDALIEAAEDRRYRLRDPGAIEMRLSLYRERFPELLAGRLGRFSTGPSRAIGRPVRHSLGRESAARRPSDRPSRERR